jgi:hypothetical protein
MPNSSENTQHAPRAFSGVDRLLGNGAFSVIKHSSATVIGRFEARCVILRS